MVTSHETKQSCLLLFFLFGFHITVFSSVYYLLFSLPNVPEGGENRGFSVTQARYYLENITSYGVRYVGSKANEEEMPKFFTEVLSSIMESSNQLHHEIQVTRDSGW